MSLLVLPQRPETTVSTPILRVRSWIATLRARVTEKCADGTTHFEVDSAQIAPSVGGVANVYDRAAGAEDRNVEWGAVLPFPRTGRVRLVELADTLKARFFELGLTEFYPFLLRIEAGRYPRLWIDASSYVEFHGVCVGYRVVLEDAFEARLTLETHDFECATTFIGHYIVARLDVVGRGAAS